MATVEAINTSNGSRTTAATEYDYASGKYVDPAADQWRDIYGQWHQPTKGLPPAAEGFAWVQGPNGAWTQTYVGDQKSLTAPTTSVHIGLGNPGSPFEFGASTRNDSIFHSSGISRDLPQEGTSQAGPATGVYGQAPGIPGIHTDPNDPGYNNPSNPGLRNRLHPEAGLIDQNANPANQRFLSSGGSGSPKFIANPGPPNYPTGGPVAGGDDLAKARSLRDALTAQSQGTQPRTAPRVAPAQFMTAPQAGNVQLGPTVMPTASLAGPAERLEAPRTSAAVAGAPNGVFARDVTAAYADKPAEVVSPQSRAAIAPLQALFRAPEVGVAQAGPAAQFKGATIEGVQDAFASRADAAQLDTAAQDATKARQSALLTALEAAAAGNGPSAAQAQMQLAIDQSIAAQRSLAAGAHGTGRTAAQIGAARNVGTLTGNAAASTAALRAQEINDARSLLSQGLTASRGQDITVASSNAALENAARLQNAQGLTNVSISNADRIAARSMKQAELEQAAAAGNAAAKNELSLRNAGFQEQSNLQQAQGELETNKANQSTNLQTALANAGFQQQAGLSNAQLELAARQGNQKSALETALANAGFQQQAGITNSTLGLNAQQSNQNAYLQTALANAGFQQQAGITNAQLALQTGQSNQNAALQTALQNAQLGTQTNIAGAGFQNTANLTQAQLATQTALANAGFQQGTNLANASNAIEVNKTNATLGQNQISIDDRRKADSVIAAIQAQGQVLSSANDQQRNALLAAQIADAVKRGDQAAVDRYLGLGLQLLSTGAGLAATFGRGGSSGGATDYSNGSPYTQSYGYGSQSGAGGDFLGDDG